MATCEIDVLPNSLFGSPCGRRIVADTGCPVHGWLPGPRAADHPEPSPARVISTMEALAEALLVS